jgi:hypothetical protein
VQHGPTGPLAELREGRAAGTRHGHRLNGAPCLSRSAMPVAMRKQGGTCMAGRGPAPRHLRGRQLRPSPSALVDGSSRPPFTRRRVPSGSRCGTDPRPCSYAARRLLAKTLSSLLVANSAHPLLAGWRRGAASGCRVDHVVERSMPRPTGRLIAVPGWPLSPTTGHVELHGAGDQASASTRRTARAAAPRPDPCRRRTRSGERPAH